MRTIITGLVCLFAVACQPEDPGVVHEEAPDAPLPNPELTKDDGNLWARVVDLEQSAPEFRDACAEPAEFVLERRPTLVFAGPEVESVSFLRGESAAVYAWQGRGWRSLGDEAGVVDVGQRGLYLAAEGDEIELAYSPVGSSKDDRCRAVSERFPNAQRAAPFSITRIVCMADATQCGSNGLAPFECAETVGDICGKECCDKIGQSCKLKADFPADITITNIRAAGDPKCTGNTPIACEYTVNYGANAQLDCGCDCMN